MHACVLMCLCVRACVCACTTEVLLRSYGRYDQIEFVIPIEKAVNCFTQFLDVLDKNPDYKVR